MIIDEKVTKKSLFSLGLGYRNIKLKRILYIVGIAFFCIIYLNYAWIRYEKLASKEALILAQSLEAMITPEYITGLTGSNQDLDNPEYIKVKENLIRMVNVGNPIRFAYLMAEKDDNIILLMDSEKPGQPDYSPPGQLYEEADELIYETFRTGKESLTSPITDRWGTGGSALGPVKNNVDGRIIAVFGSDDPAEQCYANIRQQMVPDTIIVLSIVMLFFAFLRYWTQHNELKSVNKQLAFDEALYHGVFEHAPIGIAISDGRYGIARSEYGSIKINRMYESIIGRMDYQIEDLKWTEITHPDDLEVDIKNFEQLKKGEIKGYTLEKRFIRPDGSVVWTNMKLAKLLDDSDQNATHLCLLEDITMKKEIENSLRESERSKTLLISKLPGMAYKCRYDKEWIMEFVSDGCLKLTGYMPESLLNNRDLSFFDLITSQYRELYQQEWKRVLANKSSFVFEYEIVTINGENKWVLELGEAVYEDKNEVVALEGIILDITDRKEIENNLRYINEHDMVTGLYNGRYLDEYYSNMLKEGSVKKCAFVGVNLSTIQLLSLTYGFYYSQELVKKVAEGLRTLSDENHHIFYTYVNRFIFFIKDYKDKDELIAFCNLIISQLEIHLAIERIGGGLGIVELDENNKYNLDEILKNLLIASEKAIVSYEKDFGYSFYDKNMEKERIREEKLRRNLVKISSEEDCEDLFMVFQAIYDLNTNRISGFEALARINSKELGLIGPGEFIPLAEKTKFIIPLGRIIILKSLKFLKILEENGYNNISISINISAIQLLRNDFIKEFFEIIEMLQVNANSIEIELTESIFSSNYEDINNILSELKSVGIKISIDDFGTEYSSLARERELNVNCLKIDKVFIDKLLFLSEDEAITADIISMAHKMGHIVIAEGVEEEVQLKYLEKHGCDKIQGYLISKPIEADKAIELLIDKYKIV